jgi:hypothetical protein
MLHVLADGAEPDVHLPGVDVRHHQLKHLAPVMLQLLLVFSLQLPHGPCGGAAPVYDSTVLWICRDRTGGGLESMLQAEPTICM